MGSARAILEGIVYSSSLVYFIYMSDFLFGDLTAGTAILGILLGMLLAVVSSCPGTGVGIPLVI